MKCDRCKKEIMGFTVSRMNLDNICEECEEKEKKHPRYREAYDKELQEVLKGNMNYPGLFHGQKWPFGEESLK